MTVYDASYVALVRKHGLELITGDEELEGEAGHTVEAVSIREIPKQACCAR